MDKRRGWRFLRGRGWILFVSGWLLLGTGWMQGCASFGCTGQLVATRFTTLPSGQNALVIEEQIEGPRAAHYRRFEVYDAQTGERQQRLAQWFWVDGNDFKADFLGGIAARQGWSRNNDIVLTDATWKRIGVLSRTCKTISQEGPCGAKWLTPEGAVAWQLTVDDLRGDELTSIEQVNADTVYIYARHPSFYSFVTSSCYLYAVDFHTGKIRWRRGL